MSVTWISKQLTVSIELSVGELLDMLKQLSQDEQTQAAIELLVDFDQKSLKMVKEQVDEWIAAAY